VDRSPPRAQYPPVSEPPPGSPPPSRATVLVASSDSATRELLRGALNVPAVDLVDAADGVEALALAGRLDLDLVVLDAFLAVVDGVTVCSRIRALPDVEQPPILVLGLSPERAIEVALTSGADDTLTMPLDTALLRHRARVLLGRHQHAARRRLVQRAVEAASAGVAILDARSSEYEVAFANASFLRQTGYAAEEILGHNLRLLSGPETDVAAMTELRQAFAEGRPTRVLLRSYRKDGRPYWNDVAAAPVVDASGRLTHLVTVQSDVTALLEAPERETARAVREAVGARTRKLETALARVEERRRFTETILNAMVSAILATDAEGKVLFANLAALRTLGTSLRDCVGRSVVELFGHHEGVAEVIAGSVPAHPEHRLDFPLVGPDGTRFYVGMSISPAPPTLRDEVAFIFLFRDLAETIDIETDPKLKQLTAAQDAADAALPPGPGAAPGGAAAGAPPRAGLELQPAAPADLARTAIQALAELHQADGAFVRLETADDVPEVLLDRQQVVEALTLLLSGVLEGCPDPADVRVRLTRGETPDGPGGGPAPAARIEIAYPAVITDRDLGTDPGATARRPSRRMDFAIAAKLLEANGGRLVLAAGDAAGPALAVLLRARP
ncbi:MAG TPA: PAS domain-containing protein, partial [Vicinamibacteria bacterium]|nr:PAS domain-containing protein [Vicinamibacteria bacterium]